MGGVTLRTRLRRYAESELFWLLLVCALGIFFAVLEREVPHRAASAQEPETMLFVGDVMLARHVETLMREHGAYYPFLGVRDVLDAHTYVIGNFEGTIPERHVPTPTMTMRFSSPREVATVLARAGFTDMTLANNHALDHGRDGYTHTQTVLREALIGTGGDPVGVRVTDVLYRTLDGTEVAIVPLNAVGGAPAYAALAEVLRDAAAASDLQVVSVHWGTEYVPVAGAAEQALAHTLIDLGADAIIGHHPHVVQQIEEYRGAPIFYSLGNFIFDQYWNDAVQEGLAVSLSVVDGAVRYELIPLSSVATRSAPAPMLRAARTAFLAALAAKSEEDVAAAVRKALITELLPQLASS